MMNNRAVSGRPINSSFLHYFLVCQTSFFNGSCIKHPRVGRVKKVNFKVRLFVAISCPFVGCAALAQEPQESQEPPEVKSWISEVEARGNLPKNSFILVEGKENKASTAKIDNPDFGFMQLVPFHDVSLAITLNNKPSLEKLSYALKLKKMFVLNTTEAKLSLIEKNLQKEQRDTKAVETVTRESVEQTLREVLGYDGIVVDQKDIFLLALLLPSGKKLGEQGIVVLDSERMTFVDRQTQKTSAYLEIVEVSRQYAVFRIAIRGKKVKFGSKVQVE
jgi:hypothetical protein